MRKEIKTEEWKISLMVPIFFGTILLIFTLASPDRENWSGWPYVILAGLGALILTLIALKRKTYMEDEGIVTWNNSKKRSRISDFFMNKYIRWSEIKKVSFELEDRSNYVFGKNKKRGNIVIQTGNEHVELRLVLNPEDVVREIKQQILLASAGK